MCFICCQNHVGPMVSKIITTMPLKAITWKHLLRCSWNTMFKHSKLFQNTFLKKKKKKKKRFKTLLPNMFFFFLGPQFSTLKHLKLWFKLPYQMGLESLTHHTNCIWDICSCDGEIVELPNHLTVSTRI